MTARLGGEATFKFQLSGSPKPKVEWFRDGMKLDLNDDDYIEYGDDFLKVKDLIDSDSGMYQARASNKWGDSQISLELLIAKGR